MGVRIDKAWHNHPAYGIETSFLWIAFEQLGCGTDRLNQSIAYQYRPIRDQPQFTEAFPALRATGKGQ
jgi:hypothetical protein